MLAKKSLRETEFDTIAFTGSSGSALAYILSHEINIPLMCVRKKHDGSHFQNGGNGRLEGNMESKRYMIVDDFICSGETIHDIMSTIKVYIKNAECVSILLYDYSRSHRSLFNGIPIFAAVDNFNYEQRSLPFPFRW
jgi:orotate phosphoribosyltransferase-like protein